MKSLFYEHRSLELENIRKTDTILWKRAA